MKSPKDPCDEWIRQLFGLLLFAVKLYVTNAEALRTNMLSIEMDRKTGIALMEPHGPLSKEDFVSAARQIDPFIEERGGLAGLIVHTDHFPGWESFRALVSHIRFVKNHHKHLRKIAIVTNAKEGDLREKMASHFIAAKIRHFRYEQMEAAKLWILEEE
ncbi:STAS/SEC14 domain-containing protein [Endozoicomonas sp. 4G]|uniref:STAS/SEC14 domain-containing protein n=1 Tax=Endozoicomonas sp. 4G TaxID=2872754 RepID=UPI002078EB47|nr:STAS/SEC14 domain-containing protein [Endozoicomonas sp. 4G]